MPTAAELALVLKFRDQATAAAKAAFGAIGQAAQAAASVPRRAFEAFTGTVNQLNAAIRLTRRFLFEVTLALSPFLAAVAIAGQNNTVVAEQLQRLQRTFRDLATEIGIRLLPALQGFADFAQRHAPDIVKAFEALPTILARILHFFELLFAEFANIARAIPGLKALSLVFGTAAGEIGRAAFAMEKFKMESVAAADVAKTAFAQMGAGVRIALNESYDSLKNFGALAKDMTNGAIRGLQGSMENLFTTLITRSSSAKEAFKNFALGVLTMIAQMIARLIAAAILMTILGFIPGVGPAVKTLAALSSVGGSVKVGHLQDAATGAQLTRHHGGLIPAYHGGGEVNALLEPGEFVMNRRSTAKNLTALQRMNAGGEGAPTVQNVFIINATDAASFRGRIQESADVIEAIFQRAMRRNSGAMREAVRV